MVVDLLARALADVADIDVAVRGIEAHAERVAQAQVPDLVGAGFADEGIVRRDGVVARRVGGKIVAVDVEPEDFSQQRVDVLRVVVGIVAAAAVADGDVEIAVRTEADKAAIVVGERRVRDGDDGLHHHGIGDCRVAGGTPVLLHFHVAGWDWSGR